MEDTYVSEENSLRFHKGLDNFDDFITELAVELRAGRVRATRVRVAVTDAVHLNQPLDGIAYEVLIGPVLSAQVRVTQFGDEVFAERHLHDARLELASISGRRQSVETTGIDGAQLAQTLAVQRPQRRLRVTTTVQQL